MLKLLLVFTLIISSYQLSAKKFTETDCQDESKLIDITLQAQAQVFCSLVTNLEDCEELQKGQPSKELVASLVAASTLASKAALKFYKPFNAKACATKSASYLFSLIPEAYAAVCSINNVGGQIGAARDVLLETEDEIERLIAEQGGAAAAVENELLKQKEEVSALEDSYAEQNSKQEALSEKLKGDVRDLDKKKREISKAKEDYKVDARKLKETKEFIASSGDPQIQKRRAAYTKQIAAATEQLNADLSEVSDNLLGRFHTPDKFDGRPSKELISAYEEGASSSNKHWSNIPKARQKEYTAALSELKKVTNNKKSSTKDILDARDKFEDIIQKTAGESEFFSEKVYDTARVNLQNNISKEQAELKSKFRDKKKNLLSKFDSYLDSKRKGRTVQSSQVKDLNRRQAEIVALEKEISVSEANYKKSISSDLLPGNSKLSQLDDKKSALKVTHERKIAEVKVKAKSIKKLSKQDMSKLNNKLGEVRADKKVLEKMFNQLVKQPLNVKEKLVNDSSHEVLKDVLSEGLSSIDAPKFDRIFNVDGASSAKNGWGEFLESKSPKAARKLAELSSKLWKGGSVPSLALSKGATLGRKFAVGAAFFVAGPLAMAAEVGELALEASDLGCGEKDLSGSHILNTLPRKDGKCNEFLDITSINHSGVQKIFTTLDATSIVDLLKENPRFCLALLPLVNRNGAHEWKGACIGSKGDFSLISKNNKGTFYRTISGKVNQNGTLEVFQSYPQDIDNRKTNELGRSQGQCIVNYDKQGNPMDGIKSNYRGSLVRRGDGNRGQMMKLNYKNTKKSRRTYSLDKAPDVCQKSIYRSTLVLQKAKECCPSSTNSECGMYGFAMAGRGQENIGVKNKSGSGSK